jgi:uncharacterized protein (DUF1330 family)
MQRAAREAMLGLPASVAGDKRHEGGRMAAYCIFDITEIHDEQKMAEYRDGVIATVAQFSGRYIVIGGTVDLLEGAHKPVFPVIIEFPSLAQAHSWYESEEYGPLREARRSATSSSAYFVAGIDEAN